jgi:hypothetical protein
VALIRDLPPADWVEMAAAVVVVLLSRMWALTHPKIPPGDGS